MRVPQGSLLLEREFLFVKCRAGWGNAEDGERGGVRVGKSNTPQETPQCINGWETYGLSFLKQYTWIEKLKGKGGAWIFVFLDDWVFFPKAYLGELSWQPNHLKHPETLTRHGVIPAAYHPSGQVGSLSSSPCFWTQVPALLALRRHVREEVTIVGIPTAGWHTLWPVGPACLGSSTVSSRVLPAGQAQTSGSGLQRSVVPSPHLTDGNNNNIYLVFNY